MSWDYSAQQNVHDNIVDTWPKCMCLSFVCGLILMAFDGVWLWGFVLIQQHEQ